MILSIFDFQKGSNYNCFDSSKPDSFHFVQFIFQLLTNICDLLNEELEPLNVDDSIFQAAWDISDNDFSESPIPLSEEQYITLSSSSSNISLFDNDDNDNNNDNNNISETLQKSTGNNDSIWLWVPKLLQAIIYFIQSPFPNFGIMEIYNDRSFFILFEKIIGLLGKQSLYSILSIPSLQIKLANYLWVMLKNFSAVIISTPQYWQNILDITRVLFLSNLPDVLQKIYFILHKSIQTIIQISDMNQLFQLRPHFVLTLNLISLQIKSLDRLTFFALQYGKYDKDFFFFIGEKIAESISDPTVRGIFLEKYGNLLRIPFHPESPENEIIQNFRECFLILPIRPMDVPPLAEFFHFIPS